MTFEEYVAELEESLEPEARETLETFRKHYAKVEEENTWTPSFSR